MTTIAIILLSLAAVMLAWISGAYSAIHIKDAATAETSDAIFVVVMAFTALCLCLIGGLAL